MHNNNSSLWIVSGSLPPTSNLGLLLSPLLIATLSYFKLRVGIYVCMLQSGIKVHACIHMHELLYWQWLWFLDVWYSDGVGRTGTFICIHAMLERVNTENIMDFFQFIKASRIHRPSLVLELVSGCGSSHDLNITYWQCDRSTTGSAMML